MREKLVAALVAVLVSTSIVAVGYLESQKDAVIEELTKFGFDRTFVVSPIQGDLSGSEASDYMASHPTVSDGTRGVFSRVSALALASHPQVERSFVITRTLNNLKLTSGESMDVVVFNVPQTFLLDFKIDPSNSLLPNRYTASASLHNFLHAPTATKATLGVAKAQVDLLPEDMKAEIDWTKARIAIDISERLISFPSGSQIFNNALFTTGKEQKISIPGVQVIPRLDMFVQVRRSIATDQAMEEVRAFLKAADPAQPRATMSIVTMDEYFSEELGIAKIDKWARTVYSFIALAGAFIFGSILMTRQHAIQAELKLRRLIGVSRFSSAWLTVKPFTFAISIGFIGAVAISVPVHFLLFSLPYQETVKAIIETLIGTSLLAILLLALAYSYAHNKLTLAKNA